MSGKDVCGIAQTGTGKTYAYLLPCLRQIEFNKNKIPQLLVIVPTRELVVQVVEAVEKMAAYMTLADRATAAQVRSVIGFTGLAMLFVYSTLEVNTFLHSYAPGMQSGGVSILWSTFALAFIMRGIAKNEAVVRYLGLGLFAIVSAKVFFIDLDRLDQFYRIIAFVVLGLLLLAGSFGYFKYREKFVLEPEPTQDEPI